jgi:predicted dehydrogenase
MRHTFLAILFLASGLAAFCTSTVSAQPSSQSGTASSAPLRVAIAGLVHGHVGGFLQQNLHRSDIQIVGVAEPDSKLSAFYESKFALAHDIFFASVEEMLRKTTQQAVLVYTNTFDHRSVVEA